MSEIEGGHTGSATFSYNRAYRYELRRVWGSDHANLVLFVMLNPSTADEKVLDPTLRRCKGFAEGWGFDGMVIRNLFSYRATDPKALTQVPFPVGPETDYWLRQTDGIGLTVVGWGGSLPALTIPRSKEVLPLLKEPHALGLTKSGQPRHPLYLSKESKLTPYGGA